MKALQLYRYLYRYSYIGYDIWLVRENGISLHTGNTESKNICIIALRPCLFRKSVDSVIVIINCISLLPPLACSGIHAGTHSGNYTVLLSKGVIRNRLIKNESGDFYHASRYTALAE